ncbi:MAG: hypothetical protein M1831_002428 [Alyxoria varia]|nr:MAG: hypothetical protein M1831_002428 [Alyxoria varia]
MLESSRPGINDARAGTPGDAGRQQSQHLSTVNVLRNFKHKASDSSVSERSRRRSAVAGHRSKERKTQRQFLDQLELEKRAKNVKRTLWDSFSSKFKPWLEPIPWRTLVNLAHDFFPPRMALPVHVCDISANHAVSFKTTLGEIEICWKEKPEWAVVRWIHAPLGVGLIHSSIEDMFLHDWHHGKPFHNAGSPGWPFLAIEHMQLQRRCLLQDTRDAYALLKADESVTRILDTDVLSGDRNETFGQDLKWRSRHLGIEPGFWELSSCDIPMLLSEGIPMGGVGAIEPVRGRGRAVDDTAITKHPQFENSRLVTRPFRAFHHSDGCVLTMSSAKGVDYLSRDLPDHLDEPPDDCLEDPDASVVGNLLREFESTGARDWESHTPEYFLVYLLTEIGVTPHNIKDGYNAISIFTAMQAAVQNMKQRTFDEWSDKETTNLVREYLVCIDELKTLNMLFSKKIEFFENLAKDVSEHRAAELADAHCINSGREGSRSERIEWALNLLKHQNKDVEILLTDVFQAMNALFQLCSIKQNKLAITSDRQNKAILIFTGFTIVFLPLSFFTSYYGMNLRGVADTAKTESYFWKVCGSITLVIVCVISLMAFCLRLQTVNILRLGRRSRTSPV